MNENKAKEKWCPFARILCPHGDEETPAYGSHNRFENSIEMGMPLDSYCIGSDCMAWRWSAAALEGITGAELHPAQGYCGLVGKP